MAAPISFTEETNVLTTLADAVEDRDVEIKQYGDVENMVNSDKNAESDNPVLDMFYASSGSETILSTNLFSIVRFLKLGLPWPISITKLEHWSWKMVQDHWKRYIVYRSKFVETWRKRRFNNQSVQFQRNYT